MASMIETLENQVQGPDQRCGMLKSKRAIYQGVFQTCEQLASTGINILQMELPVLFNEIHETAYFLSISLP